MTIRESTMIKHLCASLDFHDNGAEVILDFQIFFLLLFLLIFCSALLCSTQNVATK